jgi:hypothetical protein
MLLVWAYLREAIPFVDHGMAAFKERQELQRLLGHDTDLLLGLDARKVVREAGRVPAL